ncbi:hypothetical protein CAI21_04480 [Alkalilimnicola ehrlichii]|uniref:Serine aminopeptidase S33 domain-containing protein n=1 Tax=Alkalilimnicola ehrlichii TaxID=351052 RepID=A0A3E0X100_9GAMM|nr:alpha/beta fold hydrolase [Alkalilimnicola ehrlichii]RFA30769.1 hypothetical protein CAI21_04480 [Alkalilimnicola ehrlichii]RFA38345.1 hypothetical protein CAL65_05845 [Alkalilimnicola ehrlichii]
MTDYPVIPGAEPFFSAGNDTGCLVIHGYTGSPQSVRYLGEYLAEKGGFTVSVPRLPGHGTAPEDMARTTAEDWLQCVRTALAELNERCTSIFVVGLSMGGTLSLHLAATQQDIVHGVVTINTPLFINNPQFAALAFAPDAPPFLPGVGADIKNPDANEISYNGAPSATTRQLFVLIATAREMLPLITCPVLAFRSREDHVVPPSNGPYLIDHVSSADKRLITLEDSFHVATLDNDRERIARETLQFIRSRQRTEKQTYTTIAD